SCSLQPLRSCWELEASAARVRYCQVPCSQRSGRRRPLERSSDGGNPGCDWVPRPGSISRRLAAAGKGTCGCGQQLGPHRCVGGCVSSRWVGVGSTWVAPACWGPAPWCLVFTAPRPCVGPRPFDVSRCWVCLDVVSVSVALSEPPHCGHSEVSAV